MVADGTRCDWPDCTKSGDYPAPAGPQTNERRNFCYDHVREYNRSYNYFEGMSQDEAESFRRAAQTGHRPTWSMGTRRARGSKVEDWQFQDPLEIMGEAGFTEAGPAGAGARASKVTSGQKRALDVMELPETAKPADVRKKFKILVKQYHPDANGGDRSHEDDLQSVIQAHDFLKASGFC
jgi:DnaJ-domain-containing protein 1